VPCEKISVYLFLVVSVIFLMLTPDIVTAAFYKYTDGEGVVHFLDDPGKIPRQYLKKIKIYEGGATDNGNGTRVRIIGNQVLVPAVLGYGNRRIDTTLVLDTGASITAVDSSMLEGMRPEPGKSRAFKARVADGRVVAGSAVKVDFIEVGSHRVSDIYVALIPHQGTKENHDGLLGMNFLRNYDYRIDFEKQRIYWK
jgi:hypothetical protein